MMVRGIPAAGLLFAAALVLEQCTSAPATSARPESAAPVSGSELTPVLSVKELMEHVIDPTADWIFDAAVIDVSAEGTSETRPITDEDWLKVERGALLLAESANLLKMPRPMVPPGTEGDVPESGEPAPELAPSQIQAKIDRDRSLWNKHADELRLVALESLTIVKARDFDGLFAAGSDIDRACESCHLEYWYPGDKAAVLADQQKRVTYDPPR
jgi:hypothetical protein